MKMDRSGRPKTACASWGASPPLDRRRTWRWGFYLACLLLWLLVLVGAGEAWIRLAPPSLPLAPETIPFTISEARRRFEPVYARYATSWPYPEPKVPDLSEFERGDAETRTEIARIRGEWILIVTRDGTVHHAHGKAPEGLMPHAPTLPFSIDALADAAFAEPVQDALNKLFAGEHHAPITAPANHMAAAERWVVEFYPIIHDGVIREVLLAISPSLYRGDLKRFKPGMHPRTFTTSVMMEQFSTNSLGHRGPEITVPKPPGVVRIVCLGGSTTVWGYTDELTYPAMLQQMLRDHYPRQAHRIETVNCGIFGLTSGEELAMMDEILLLEPDLLIHYNFINDLSIHLPTLFNDDDAWKSIMGRLKRLLRHSRLIERHAGGHLLPSPARMEASLFQSTLGNLEAIDEIARRHGVITMFCSFAGLVPEAIAPEHRLYAEMENTRRWFPALNLNAYTTIRRAYNEALRKFCGARQIQYIPVAENICGSYDLLLDLCHFNPRGTEKQARIVFETVTRHLADLLGP